MKRIITFIELFTSPIIVMVIPVNILGWFDIHALWLYGVGGLLGVLFIALWIRSGYAPILRQQR